MERNREGFGITRLDIMLLSLRAAAERRVPGLGAKQFPGENSRLQVECQ